MTRFYIFLLFFVAAGALALRLPYLDRRPFHTDESVHATKFLQLWEKGVYKYDPDEYHGPSLYYATYPIIWLQGFQDRTQLNDRDLRLVIVLFGIAIILLLAILHDALGRFGILFAALFTAISPAMVFYSRYFIHEIPFVFFTLMFLGGLWRYWQCPKWTWAVFAGLGLGFMHATKETFVFNLAAITAAAVVMVLTHWEKSKEQLRLNRNRWIRDSALMACAALVVSIALFTSFFTNPSGPIDSIKTYLPWISRAGGESPHIHPWDYYLKLLFYKQAVKGPIWSEALILALALIGAISAWFGRKNNKGEPVSQGATRFLAIYTLALTVIYCVIPYKTPWCALGFLHGMILLAGVGSAYIATALSSKPGRIIATLLVLAGSLQLGYQAWRTNFVYYVDQRNPYVYAHTIEDVFNLAKLVDNISKTHPKKRDMIVETIAPGNDYWPLPWYLRQFRNIGGHASFPDKLFGDVLIISPILLKNLKPDALTDYVSTGFFGHRPRVFQTVYVKKEVWDCYLKNKPPEED